MRTQERATKRSMAASGPALAVRWINEAQRMGIRSDSATINEIAQFAQAEVRLADRDGRLPRSLRDVPQVMELVRRSRGARADFRERLAAVERDIARGHAGVR